MGGNKDLPKKKISNIVKLLKTGKFSLRCIAEKEMISVGTVHKISTRLKNNDDPTVSQRINCRGIRKFDPRVDRKIVRIVKKDRSATTTVIKRLLEEENLKVSISTIRRRLAEAKIKRFPKKEKKKPSLTKKDDNSESEEKLDEAVSNLNPLEICNLI